MQRKPERESTGGRQQQGSRVYRQRENRRDYDYKRSPAAPAGSAHGNSLTASVPALTPLDWTTWTDLCRINEASTGRAIVIT